jgi:hypothetical protein
MLHCDCNPDVLAGWRTVGFYDRRPVGQKRPCANRSASTANAGTISRIVPQHPEGAIVSVPRTDVHYAVTDYGVVDLLGKSQRERAERLISMAHPDFREALRRRQRHFFRP